MPTGLLLVAAIFAILLSSGGGVTSRALSDELLWRLLAQLPDGRPMDAKRMSKDLQSASAAMASSTAASVHVVSSGLLFFGAHSILLFWRLRVRAGT